MNKDLFHWGCFETDRETGLVEVNFFDIPNAVTFGKDIEDAYFMAIDVLAATLADYPELPKSSSYEDLRVELTDENILVLVPVDKDLLAKYKTHVPRGDIVEAYQDAEMKAAALKEMLRAV